MDMVQVRYALLAGLVAPTLALASACNSTPASGAAPSASASVAAPTSSASSASSASAPQPVIENRSDDVKPVYPESHDPPDPAATLYCDLVHEAAEKKRQACCPEMPFSSFRPTGECVRTLSHALRSKAVVLDKALLDACAAAVAEEAKRCDWGGSMPAACEGIARGQLDENARCRSALECKEGLQCGGLGAVTPGTCARPGTTGKPCGGSVDTLASFIRQDAERAHPQCEGHCERRRCADTVPVGGACKSSLQCGQGRNCLHEKCSDAPLPAAGEPCAQKACRAGLACVKDTCMALRRLDEACESDAECRSGSCERPGGSAGKCAMACQIIRPKPASSGAPAVRPTKP